MAEARRREPTRELHPSPALDGDDLPGQRMLRRLDVYAGLGTSIAWDCDADWHVSYVSDNVEKVLGFSPGDWRRGDLWWERIHPRDREVVERRRTSALGGGSAYSVEYRLFNAGGAEIWLRESGRPTGQEAPAFRGILEDVTTVRHLEKRLALKDRTAEILANAATVDEAAKSFIEMVCEALDWDWGAIWTIDHADNVLRCTASYGRTGIDLADFERESARCQFERGIGLPGRVWASGAPAWIPDLAADRNFPRVQTALRVGLRSGSGFPVMLGSQVLGAMEFFAVAEKGPDPELVQLMTNLGRQIGQFSERKAVEEELAISEERYRSLAEALPAMVAILTPTGALAYANALWMEYTGLALPELQEAWPEAVAHPDDVEAVRDASGASRYGGVRVDVDYRIRRRDGMYRWHAMRAVPMRGDGGRVVRWLSTTTDIEDRKRAERAQEFLADATALLASSLNYEAALRNLTDLVVPTIADIAAVDVFEADGSSRRIASRAGDDAKQGLLEELHVRNWPVSEHGEHVSDVLGEGRSIFFEDAMAWRRWLEGLEGASAARRFGARSVMIVPLRARNRTIGALSLISAESNRYYARSDLEVAEELGRRAGIAVDNARLYQDAQKSADELRKANAAKDEFLGLVSHELRTPITTIYGNAQVLRHRGEHLDPETRDLALADVESEADRLHRIIDNMLVLARAESQRSLETEPLLVQHAIDRVVDAHKLRHRGRDVTVVCDRELAPVSAEPTYFEQVLTNLLNNAEKYSDPGAPIEIRASRERDEVAVRVLDRGRGIDPEETEQIFGAFFRSARTAAGASGAGIGLAVCKRLVEAQGGHVWAGPRDEGPGAEIGFALPLVRETGV